MWRKCSKNRAHQPSDLPTRSCVSLFISLYIPLEVNFPSDNVMKLARVFGGNIQLQAWIHTTPDVQARLQIV